MSSHDDDPLDHDNSSTVPLEAQSVDRWLDADGQRWSRHVPSHDVLDERALIATLGDAPTRPTPTLPGNHNDQQSRQIDRTSGAAHPPQRRPLLTLVGTIAAVVIVSLFAALLHGLAAGRNPQGKKSTPTVSASLSASPTVSAPSGSIIWRQSVSGTISSQPALDDGVVVFGTSDMHLWALNAQSGAKVWDVVTANPVVFPVKAANGLVVVNEEDPTTFTNALAVYRESDGSLVGRVHLTAAGFGPPIVANGTVIADAYPQSTGSTQVTCSPSLKEGASRFTPAGNPASPRRPCPGPRRHRRGRPGRLKKPYSGAFSQRRTKPAMRLCGLFAACGWPGLHPQSSSQGASAGSYARRVQSDVGYTTVVREPARIEFLCHGWSLDANSR
jgi:hypothetical protein